jgi:hypothetical protein
LCGICGSLLWTKLPFSVIPDIALASVFKLDS